MSESPDADRFGRESFTGLADLLPIPVAIWTDDGLAYANPAFLALTGRSAIELRDVAWTALLAPECRDGVSARRHALFHGSAAVSADPVVLIGRNGESVPIRQTLTALGGGDDSPILLTAVDETAYRQAEDARLEAEARYRRLFEDGLTPIAVLNPTGVIVECNRAVRRMFAIESADDLVGQAIANFVHDPTYLNTLIAAVSAEGPGEIAELQARRADGELIEVAARLSGTFDPGGKLISVQLLLEELTDRKRLETHLAGVQRTEAIGRLAGGLAHDFNNLLTVIGGHSDYLIHTLAESDPRRSSARSIHQASHRAAALTRQLLAFGRRQVFQLRVVEIRRLLSDVQPMLARVLGDGIQLVMDINEVSPQINVDPVQLEQILVNLSLNARDALTDGGVLTIRTDLMDTSAKGQRERPWIRAGSYLRIDVTDSGAGMDEGVRARVFEPFFTTKQMGRGSGLGLATVYGIVKQSDGYIWVVSELGRGTTFTMLFPACAAAEAEVPVARPGTMPHESVLLVEQDDNLRSLLSDALRRRGYQVFDADSAARAAELFGAREGQIDLVVADVEHADGPGEVAERLRAMTPRLRVLYMTATGATSTPASPHDGFIPKPFSVQAFADRVREILAARLPEPAR